MIVQLGVDSTRWVGVAMSVFALGQCIAAPVSSIAAPVSSMACLYRLTWEILGKVSSRVGLGWVFVAGEAVGVAGDVLYGQANNVWLLLGGRLLAGVGAGTLQLEP